MRRTCSFFFYIKFIYIDTFVKQVTTHAKLLKCSNQISPKFLLCVLKCHWLENFRFESFSQFRASLTTAHKIYKICSFFERQHLPFWRYILIKINSSLLKFSIPNTPGHLNPHVIIVKIYRSMGIISKQSLSTNVPVCIHVELIGQLSAYRLQYTNMYR